MGVCEDNYKLKEQVTSALVDQCRGLINIIVSVSCLTLAPAVNRFTHGSNTLTGRLTAPVATFDVPGGRSTNFGHLPCVA